MRDAGSFSMYAGRLQMYAGQRPMYTRHGPSAAGLVFRTRDREAESGKESVGNHAGHLTGQVTTP